MAKIFRAARKYNNLKQVDISKAINVTQGTVSKLENGILKPDTTEWYAFCKCTGMDPDLSYRTKLVIVDSCFKRDRKLFKGEVPLKGDDAFITVKECLPLLYTINNQGFGPQLEKQIHEAGYDVDMLSIASLKLSLDVVRIIHSYLEESLTETQIINQTDSLMSDHFKPLYKKLTSARRLVPKIVIRELKQENNVFTYTADGDDIVITLNNSFANVKCQELLEKHLKIRTTILEGSFPGRLGLVVVNIHEHRLTCLA